MNIAHSIMKVSLFACITLLCACSSGPAEKPLPESLSSPAYLLDQGIQEYADNNYASAINIFSKALLQYRSIDNQTGIARSCMNLANAHMAINNNDIAATYLKKADEIIQQSSLIELQEHLQLLKSTLAINNGAYETALEELPVPLNSKTVTILLAALKNRTNIAFTLDTDDKQSWLDKYKTLQKKTANTPSHLARIYRFEADLAKDISAQNTLLAQALNISRKIADRPAIAATLTQWASIDIRNNSFLYAEDKNIRALFIRHQLGDVKNSLKILKQLNTIYIETKDSKQSLTENWIEQLSNNNMKNWPGLFDSYNTYPK